MFVSLFYVLQGNERSIIPLSDHVFERQPNLTATLLKYVCDAQRDRGQSPATTWFCALPYLLRTSLPNNCNLYFLVTVVVASAVYFEIVQLEPHGNAGRENACMEEWMHHQGLGMEMRRTKLQQSSYELKKKHTYNCVID